MNNIRVNYSGFIAFIGGLISVTLGFIFTLTVTRTLTPEDYGVWGLLFSIVSYLLISEVIISYWTTRQIARGENIGKSSILSSLFLSISIIPVFIIYIFFISQNGVEHFETLLLGILLIPVIFLSQTLSSINLGHKPHIVSFSQIIFQLIKIPLALLTLTVFDLGVLGIVIAIFFAFVGKIFVSLYYSKDWLKNKFSLNQLRNWIKFSWVPMFAHIPNFLITVDVALYSLVTGSVIGIAYFQASYAIAAIVQNSGTISQALYPKLLSNKKFDGIKTNFNYILYFSILLVGISIIFSKPALFAFNPLYQNIWPIVIIISLRIFLQSLRTIPFHIINGTEQIDTEKNPTFSRLIKSNLFKMPKIISIFYSLYVISLVIILAISKNLSYSELDLVIFWALIGLFIEIPISIYLWTYSRQYFKISFPVKNFLKYVIGISSMAIFFFMTSEIVLNYEPSIYVFLPSLLIELIMCVLIFIGITYFIDNQTRNLFKLIFHEIASFSPK